MFEKISVSLLVFLNSLGLSIDPKLMSEEKTIIKIEKEIKAHNRKIEWIEVTDDDYASKHVRIEKHQKKILNLKNQITKIKKVSDLKKKWAIEDSISSLKK